MTYIKYTKKEKEIFKLEWDIENSKYNKKQKLKKLKDRRKQRKKKRGI